VFGRRRRRGRRRDAGWLGRYATLDAPWDDWDRWSAEPLGWARCRVLDVSIGGVGLELLGHEVAVGDRMTIDLQLVRSTMAWVALTGEVRHAATTDDVQRVGIRFVDVSDLQHALLRRLLERQKQAKGRGQVVGSLDLQRVRRG